jgi:hypothetical protein
MWTSYFFIIEQCNRKIEDWTEVDSNTEWFKRIYFVHSTMVGSHIWITYTMWQNTENHSLSDTRICWTTSECLSYTHIRLLKKFLDQNQLIFLSFLSSLLYSKCKLTSDNSMYLDANTGYDRNIMRQENKKNINLKKQRSKWIVKGFKKWQHCKEKLLA